MENPTMLFLRRALSAALALVFAGVASAQTTMRPPVTPFGPKPLAQSKIAFVGNQAVPPYGSQRDIFVINPDGTGLVNLTHDALTDLRPTWSPDGTKIAFITLDGGNCYLRVVNADGTGLRRVMNDHVEYTAPIAWSPDSRALAYVAALSLHLCRINVDGMQKTELTHFKVGGIDWGANNKLVFNKTEVGEGWMQLYSLNPDGTGLTLLSRGFRKVQPLWSPNGQKLAYEELVPNMPTGNVVLSKPNGAEPNSVGGGWHAAWSRDGRKVAFIESLGNRVAVSVDGGMGSRIPTTGLSDSPSFSPDGQSIAYGNRDGGPNNGQLMVIPASGGTARPILPKGISLGRETVAPGYPCPRYIAWCPVASFPPIRTTLPAVGGVQ